MTNEPNTITEPQFKFLCDLVAKKDLSSLSEREIAFLESDTSNFMRMSKAQASNAIAKIKDLPNKPKPVAQPTAQPEVSDSYKLRYAQMMLEANNSSKVETPTPNSPAPAPTQAEVTAPDAGYYFNNDPTGDPPGKESFFRVRKGRDDDPKWAGFTFLDAQGSDDFYPIRNAERREIIFREILKDPINAMNEYGLRLERCGVCNRTLTDRDSRLRGIGPICAARLDAIPTQEDIDLLTALGMIDPES